MEFYRVISGASPFEPEWGRLEPARVVQISFDTSKSSEENGADLKAAMEALQPGDRLEIGSGSYTLASYVALNLSGNATSPIWIAAGPGAQVRIARPDAAQNLVNLGVGGLVRYLCLEGIEFTGGSTGIRLGDCQELWITQCKIHSTGGIGLSANSTNTSRLFITQNEISNTGTAGGTGECLYLGGNNGFVTMSESVIAMNHIHSPHPNAVQGEGIDLKQGSWGNLVAWNLIHDCNYPCLVVGGTNGKTVNIVENNTLYRSQDSVLQVQGECIVRNNLVVSGAVAAFQSRNMQGGATEIKVVHNTFINNEVAVRLRDWENGDNMVFANNACYSNFDAPINAMSSLPSVTFSGNVAFGVQSVALPGFVSGKGMSDFVSLSWDAFLLDARPSQESSLLGVADDTYATELDIAYSRRSAPHAAGCYVR